MKGLGELEAAVMDVLWQAGIPLPVREVLHRLNTGRTLAYTTVMTVLDNLHRKEWVLREKKGRAWQYWPAGTREELVAHTLRRALETIGRPDVVLLHFARSASDRELAVLRQVLDERSGGER